MTKSPKNISMVSSKTSKSQIPSSKKVENGEAKKSPSPITPTSKRGNMKQPEVISLVEIEQRQVKEAVKRSIRDVFSTTNKDTSNKKQKTEIIVLSDSDDDDEDDGGGGKMPPCSSTATIDNYDGDDEIMVVDAAEALKIQTSLQSPSATSATAKSNNDDDEIMEIGIKNGMDLV